MDRKIRSLMAVSRERFTAHFGTRATTLALALLLVFAFTGQAMAQSQAINASIEGTVADSTGAAVTDATVTITNVETGATRTLKTDAAGFYRAPLLPLGSYRVSAESPSFKKLVREGITLTTGQSATINLALQPGTAGESITVTADAPIADTAKIDLGRVMNEIEVKNLPLVSRNPYNFAQLQANVTGRPNIEFGVPRINANGYARRTNYQLDGNNNTQTDRAGIRLMPLSEVFVQEVQLVTNGFAPEFGNTPGLIMNAVTPTGTNDFHGHASYRFRRTPFSSRPFFLASTAAKPETKVDNWTGAVGGPIVRDRWHFYTGYEWVKRDLGGESNRLVTITPAQQAQLIAAGVPQDTFVGAIPAAQEVNFWIFRTDVQLTDKHRLVGRYNLFRNTSPDNIGGGINTLQRSIDFVDRSDSVAVQLASAFSPSVLNEFRYQYAERKSVNQANANSGAGPAIVISGIANFGAPENADTVQPLETTHNIINNLSWTIGGHAIKVGGGVNLIDSVQRAGVFARYTFPTILAYQNAVNGTAPLGYTNFVQTLGNPELGFNAYFWNLFAQDDWRITNRLKVNYGLRWDYYKGPDGDPAAQTSFGQQFNDDKNNFAPRLGIVYGLREGDRPTVLRFSAGMYYDAPQLDLYRRALLNNGNGRFFNFTLTPSQAGAPAFPNTVSSGTANVQTIDALSPNFSNLYAMHTNLQIEQAITSDMSITAGFIQSWGRHIPVYRDVNLINPTGTLPDGRPIFSSTVSAANRVDPRFNHIYMAEASGNSNYTAGTLSLNKRFSQGYMTNVNYTFSHCIDDAPEQNLVATVQSSWVQSDPTNRAFDRGNCVADQRHTFSGSFVGRPQWKLENTVLNAIVNNNQLSLFATANSGETFNISGNRDLNNDGNIVSDRPVGFGRNSGRTPKQFNVDMRYSRFVRFTERYNAEIFLESINIFNIKSIFQVNSAGLAVDANGFLTAPLPDFTQRGPQALDARNLQLGFKFNF